MYSETAVEKPVTGHRKNLHEHCSTSPWITMDSGTVLKKTFSIFFQINRQDPFELCGLDRSTYVRLKIDDKAAYCRVKELLASGRMFNADDEIETICRSVDDVDYTTIEFSPEDIVQSPAIEPSTPSTSFALSAKIPSKPNRNLLSVNNMPSHKEANASMEIRSPLSAQETNFAKNAVATGSSGVSKRTSVKKNPSKQQSKAWNYFTKLDTASARCDICTNIFKHGGNTTNLTQHLRVKHPTFFVTSPKKSATNDKNHTLAKSHENSEDIDDPASSTENTSPNRNNRKRPRQSSQSTGKNTCRPARIDEAFQRAKSFSDGGTAADKITNSILFMIACDKMPISTVENEGFKEVMRTVAPLYRVPSRKTITRMMHTKYAMLKDSFKARLQAISSYTLTCDNWTDVSNQSYLGVTIHWLSSDNALNTGCLGLVPLHESHTALHLAEKILTVLDDFNLSSDKITAAVSDRAANIKKALIDTFGRSKHLACFAHIISGLVPNVITTMPEVKSIIEKVKEIVVVTKRSTVLSDELKRLQIRDGKTEGTALKFIQDVPTRWNSTLYMLNRFITLEEYVYPITVKLKNPPAMLTRNESLTLRDLVSLLEPIESVVTQISGSIYPTCSIIIPIVHCMQATIENWNPDITNGEDSATQIGTKFKAKLLLAIQHTFKDHESNSILAISTILDPRFKKVYFQSALAASSAISKINAMIKSATPAEKSTVNRNQSEFRKVKERDVWYIHDNLVSRGAYVSDENDGLSLKLRQYLNQPVIPRTEDPIRHWQSLKFAFPSLYNIAMKYLNVVATSVPSERLFSEAGNIKVDNRSRLSGEFLNELLFLGSLTREQWGFT